MFRNLITAAAFSVAASATIAQTASAKDIVDTAVEAGQFNTLVAAVQAAGLVDTLKGDGPLTVFAPTDDAFAKLPEGTVESLLQPENKDQLVAVLTYHVIAGEVTSDQLAGKQLSAATVQGADVAVDGVDGVKINDATVIAADVKASNGVIHVIDTVLLPPKSDASSGDIVDVAAAAGQFTTLLAAAEAAGLVDALKSDGPLTVFAPTDAAFAKLPAGTVDSLLKPKNRGQLAAILKYHVVPSKVTADAIVGSQLAAKTLQGRPVALNGTNGIVSVNDATVVAADVAASNGVVHVIDRVLIPTPRH